MHCPTVRWQPLDLYARLEVKVGAGLEPETTD